MAFQGASSSSSSTSRWTHDVFLSFRGEDTRDNFTAHLHKALLQKGIITFIDDEIRRGEEISPALVEAIQESRISIIVFSQSYASSRWCLDEVLEILECKKTKKQTVLAVFYKVEPSDVRNQENSFEEAFAKHEEKFKNDLKVQQWKAALKQVADLAGYRFASGNEAQFIDGIVQDVSRIVNPKYLHVAKHPVGLESRVQKINSLLRIDEKGIRTVGILGVGGIGKTTIAKDIYNSIYSQFDGCCFLESVREASKKDSGIVELQCKLLSAILGHTVNVDSVSQGISVINQRLCSKKVLLILDDVDNTEQLDKLAGGTDWFGSGSRIIITTRDRKVLIDHEVDDDLIYRVEELDREEALELFRWNAFKGAEPTDEFLKLMECAISYAGGLPLALVVLGSDMYGRDIHQWKSALEKYKRIPHGSIQEILRISYDGLHEDEKNIFLDIACFFKGKPEDYSKEILESCHFFPDHSIRVLIEKSLTTIDRQNIYGMHDLLQDMGREIVRKESPQDPSKRSRLWFHEDVRQVLEEVTGTSAIQGILIGWSEGGMCLSSEAFKNMKSLRLLMVHGDVRFSQGPIFLPNQLRVFHWPRCPLEFLPSDFHGRNLVALTMPRSCLKGLEGVQKFQSMKIMDFSKCLFLKIIPDVSKIPNLKKLTLDGCLNLVEIHDSVGSLDKLVLLSLKHCYKLSSFPTSLKLRSLQLLSLNGCKMINHFPEIECEMKYLESIQFGSTGIKELPSSIRYLTGLKKLYLIDCRNLMNLPNSIYELQHLEVLFLLHCSKLVKFPEKMENSGQSMLPPTNSSVSNDGCSSIVFPALEYLNLSGCVLIDSDFFRIFNCSSTLEELHLSKTGIVTIPACIKRFVALKKLYLENCKQLREIEAFPPKPEFLKARGCMSLDLYNNKCWLPAPGPVGSGIKLEEHLESCSFDIEVTGNNIPDWFSYRKEVSNSNSCEIGIDVPADLDGEITAIAFSTVLETQRDDLLSSIRVGVIRGGVGIYYSDPTFHSDCVWLHIHVPESFNRKEYNGHLQVIFFCNSNMKSCGVHLERRCEEKMIDSIDGIQVTKRPRDDDGNLESSSYPPLIRNFSIVPFTYPTAAELSVERKKKKNHQMQRQSYSSLIEGHDFL